MNGAKDRAERHNAEGLSDLEHYMASCSELTEDKKQLQAGLDKLKGITHGDSAIAIIERLETGLAAAKQELDETNEVLQFTAATNRNMAHRIAELEGVLDKYRWIPVGERLPKVPIGPPNKCSEHVWLIHKGKAEQGYYTNFAGWRICGSYFDENTVQNEVSHWKPIILPDQALKAKKGGG